MDEVIVTNWERTDKNNDYLDDSWAKLYPDQVAAARKLAEKGQLYDAWLVLATNYCRFRAMDSTAVFINLDGEIILEGEGEVIEKPHKKCFEA